MLVRFLSSVHNRYPVIHVGSSSFVRNLTIFLFFILKSSCGENKVCMYACMPCMLVCMCCDILPNHHFFRIPNLFFSTHSPQFNVVNVGLLSKQSWMNCKPHETTLNRGEGGMNILYLLVSHYICKKCVISICLNWFCPRL